jgi:hypothetical protein
MAIPPDIPKIACDCNCDQKPSFPLHQEDADVACCGGRAAPASRPFERPGYRISNFVVDFIQTPVGSAPIISTTLDRRDIWGTIKVRTGISRHDYKIAPGLYCVGSPGPDDPVLVTANYKLSFDRLRRDLDGLKAWVLVLDTRGVNVWCAAGKGTFANTELSYRIKSVGLEKIVDHRSIILPQLSATGVAAHTLKKECGFEVIWGPVRSTDIRQFLENNLKAEPQMRKVTFNFIERIVLIPVELTALLKYLVWLIPAVFLLSGLGPSVFSPGMGVERGILLLTALLAGVVAGVILTPAGLPWIPVRAFSAKGAIIGAMAAAGLMLLMRPQLNGWNAAALCLSTIGISSFLAMNFTGATPFTSPSGVEKEMRRAIPLQASAIFISAVCWVLGAF